MLPTAPDTAFARFNRPQALLVLVLTAAACTFFVAVTFSPLKSGFADAPSRGPGDVALYNAEAARIRAGESYYSAAAAELRERGYPTRSLLNWRLPLPVWLIGVLPDNQAGQALLGGAALLMVMFSIGWLCREAGERAAISGVLLLSGALLPIGLSDLFVMPELWCGVLIALSMAAFAQEQTSIGVVAGLAALFVRELAAPYCLLCMAIAVRQRGWREIGGWLAGIALYVGFYAWHIQQVLPLIRPDDIAHAKSWFCFGGAGFVVSTAQMNAYLLLLPQWVTALWLPLALLAAASWNTPAGTRLGLSLAGYTAAFAIVGQDFNQYWGSTTAPLFCLAAARLPAALRDLFRALDRRSVVAADQLLVRG